MFFFHCLNLLFFFFNEFEVAVAKWQILSQSELNSLTYLEFPSGNVLKSFVYCSLGKSHSDGHGFLNK